MQVVPSTDIAAPVSSALAPVTVQGTSPAPIATGVPASRPVASAAACVIVPPMDSDSATAGSLSARSETPNKSSISWLRSRKSALPGATAASVRSAATLPVSLSLRKSL